MTMMRERYVDALRHNGLNQTNHVWNGGGKREEHALVATREDRDRSIGTACPDDWVRARWSPINP